MNRFPDTNSYQIRWQNSLDPLGSITEQVKQKPEPGCFQSTVHCILDGSPESIKMPESLLRVLFPHLLPALSGEFARQGTEARPLEIAINADQLLLAQRYVDTLPRPTIHTLGAAHSARLRDILDYGGSELGVELQEQIQAHFTKNQRNYSPENLLWSGEYYANTKQPVTRMQLEEYFGRALVVSVFQARPRLRQQFPSLKAIAAGAERIPVQKTLRDKIPRPDSFEQIIDILRQIDLTRLVLDIDGPAWFWEGIGSLKGLKEIEVSNSTILQNDRFMAVLKEFPTMPKLISLKLK